MNSCPYYLIAVPSITKLADLKNKAVACREGPSRNTPIAETFRKLAQLEVGKNLTLQMPKGDQDAFNLLIDGKVDGAFLPRPFGFIAEEKGFNRITEWPDVVDDPLPITIETSEKLWRERADDFRKFLAAHQEGIRYFKSHRDDAIRILTETLRPLRIVGQQNLQRLHRLHGRVTESGFQTFRETSDSSRAEKAFDARKVASEWIATGAVKE